MYAVVVAGCVRRGRQGRAEPIRGRRRRGRRRKGSTVAVGARGRPRVTTASDEGENDSRPGVKVRKRWKSAFFSLR